MGHAIIKLDGKYLVWSSVVDAPITYGLSLWELKGWLQEEYGQVGLDWLEKKQRQIETTGISEQLYTLENLLSGNRAGPNERELTRREIITAYCRRQPLGEWYA